MQHCGNAQTFSCGSPAAWLDLLNWEDPDMSTNGAADAVRDTIYRSCLLLDDEKWRDWLELCDDEFHYAIKAWSPER